ncbi:sigma-70 family RNA polymerase sigma factor, partial [Paenibacillus sp. GCM10012303]|uniref:sigma-70 family RNA polymerase sigma factor n=1 Tax=Paenibacillus sp. GCM10012303 TaxID=3317340 RepID=UPI00361C9A77
IDYNTSFHYSRLQQAFQRFFFNIRFKKYLYSLIKFANVDYGRKIKKEKERYICSFDSPVGEEGEVTLGEILVIKMEDRVENTTFKDPELFSMSFDNEMLYFAFSKLSQRQKRVLTLVFSGDFRDSQIARQLSVSQQAVSKTKTTALHNIRMEMCQLGYSGSSSRKEIS